MSIHMHVYVDTCTCICVSTLYMLVITRLLSVYKLLVIVRIFMLRRVCTVFCISVALSTCGLDDHVCVIALKN